MNLFANKRTILKKIPSLSKDINFTVMCDKEKHQIISLQKLQTANISHLSTKTESKAAFISIISGFSGSQSVTTAQGQQLHNNNQSEAAVRTEQRELFTNFITVIKSVRAAESSRGRARNIDRDIIGDQSGSTRAGGLITERDAGKRSRPRWLELLRRRTCRGMSSGRRGAETNRGNRQRLNGIDGTAGCFVFSLCRCQTGGVCQHRAAQTTGALHRMMCTLSACF